MPPSVTVMCVWAKNQSGQCPARARRKSEVDHVMVLSDNTPTTRDSTGPPTKAVCLCTSWPSLRSLNLVPRFDRYPLRKDELPIDFMLSTGHPRIPHSNFQLIIDALVDYSNLTGIDPSQNPFAEKLTQCNTPDAVLDLLQERESAFNEYRDGNWGLINCLSPAVRVLHAFAGLLGDAVSLVGQKRIDPLYFLP